MDVTPPITVERRGHVAIDRARTSGTIDGVVVGEPEADVVLGQQDMGHTSEHIDFVIPRPHWIV